MSAPDPRPGGGSEFDLIRDYFSGLGARADVALGVGDDCALLQPPPGQQLALTTDTLVSGVHFFSDCDPETLGHKALAVNLSDLAAMGAEPAWISLGLTLPTPDRSWLQGFSSGLGRLLHRHGLQLVGGDTTRGPLAVCIQAIGFCPPGQALTRAGARPGDRVLVSGTLGDAGLALQAAGLPLAPSERALLQARLERPNPRVELGLALRGLATAAVDVSDGLAADLGHVLAASGVGANLELQRLPLSAPVRRRVLEAGDWGLPLAAGDDYELCVCVPPEQEAAALRLGRELGCGLTLVGIIEAEPGLRCRLPSGGVLAAPLGYDHFSPHGEA
jgi:thiamine-monophosphate kinase